MAVLSRDITKVEANTLLIFTVEANHDGGIKEQPMRYHVKTATAPILSSSLCANVPVDR